MGKFDNYNYEINKRLPEFWKDDLFLKPIERFSALLMRDSIQTFMEKMGVMQPFMVWKTLPEEYFWEYGFDDLDMRLADNEENPNCNQTLELSSGNHIVAQLPLTKRNVHGYIVIELSSLSFSDSTEYMPIKQIIIKNADQVLKINDIDSKTVIELYTETNTIIINDAIPKKGQVEGSIDIIKRSPREDASSISDPLDINEKCELEIYLPNEESAYCNLYVRLDHPVYVTEQNIRVFTLSAFPLEYIRLYGYMCHPFNNNHQWVYLWEKTYGYEDRIVYDKIAKQYDCEIFYAEIKLYGLPAPIYVGFPAFINSSEGAFEINDNLDYWGSILHMPRRLYKTNIPEEQERYCFPKYYAYSIEQDYPYEQRLINEYKYNEDYSDYINITDTEGTDLALVRCKDPYIDNIYMYTETIPATNILNSQKTFSPICMKEQQNNDEFKQLASWSNPKNLQYDSNSYSIITLKSQDEESISLTSYRSNILSFEFDLSSLPQNCKVKGMQLKFKGASNTHADNISIDNRSFLYYTKKVLNSETGDHIWTSKQVPLYSFFDEWRPDNASYTLGDPDSIFLETEPIDRESIEKGYLKDGLYQENKIRFDIGFSNLSDFLDITIKLFNIQLIVYFDLITEDIDVSSSLSSKNIYYDTIEESSSETTLELQYKNLGETKEVNYNSFVIIPTELCFSDDDSEEKSTIKNIRIGNQQGELEDDSQYNVLHIDETWQTSIGIKANNNPDFKSGRYDIIIICGDNVLTEEIYVYDSEQDVIHEETPESIKVIVTDEDGQSLENENIYIWLYNRANDLVYNNTGSAEVTIPNLDFGHYFLDVFCSGYYEFSKEITFNRYHNVFTIVLKKIITYDHITVRVVDHNDNPLSATMTMRINEGKYVSQDGVFNFTQNGLKMSGSDAYDTFLLNNEKMSVTVSTSKGTRIFVIDPHEDGEEIILRFEEEIPYATIQAYSLDSIYNERENSVSLENPIPMPNTEINILDYTVITDDDGMATLPIADGNYIDICVRDHVIYTSVWDGDDNVFYPFIAIIAETDPHPHPHPDPGIYT